MKLIDMFSDAAPIYVIAEIGVNHEGSVEACAKLIDAAADAGADAMKLQTIDADRSYHPETESYAIFSGAALTLEETAQMFEYARSRQIEPMTTSGDPLTLEWLDRLEPAAHKISSGLLTCTPMVKAASQTGRPVLMSTGMAEVAQIDHAVNSARDSGVAHLGLFQCTSLYPCPPEQLSLETIAWLSNRYGVPAGFSDHSVGVLAASLAASHGARFVEKHISLDTSQPGFDHRLSLEPDDFAKMVEGLRFAEQAKGQAEKTLTETESQNARKYHRRLAVRRDMAAGEVLTREDVLLMRLLPQHEGMPSDSYEDILGKVLARPVKQHTGLVSADVE
ncbi:MAG: N-acetylneuraminate synthase family protein [Rhizobiaceae bacterium]